MRADISSAWEEVRSSLYFIPGLMVLGAFVLSSALLAVDERVPDLAERLPWGFDGTASAGRTLLSTVATSLITAIAVVFSVTIVALQQASSRYTPRVLRTFTRDRGNQVVLGLFLATFAYALMVMRRLRESDNGQEAFVPALSIAAAIVLALAAIVMLVYFIHHASRSLEVSWILDSISKELEEALDEMFPEHFGRGEPPESAVLAAQLCSPEREGTIVAAGAGGYLRRIDREQLQDAIPPGTELVRVHPAMGEYLLTGLPLATIYPPARLDERGAARLRKAFALGSERSIEQDHLFGIQQLVDIVVKALSPGINDPTTAEQGLDRIGAAMARLITRGFPSPLRETGGTSYLFTRPAFAAHVAAAFDQVRRAAGRDVTVTMHLVETMARLGALAPSAERARALVGQLDAVQHAMSAGELPRSDRELIARRAWNVREQLLAPRPGA